MYSKFKVGESEVCPCNVDIMTAEHLLQHCELHNALRQDMWPEPLKDKLYGNLEELRRTAAFMRRLHLRYSKEEEGSHSPLFLGMVVPVLDLFREMSILSTIDLPAVKDGQSIALYHS